MADQVADRASGEGRPTDERNWPDPLPAIRLGNQLAMWAVTHRSYYDALIGQGFTPDQSLAIVMQAHDHLLALMIADAERLLAKKERDGP